MALPARLRADLAAAELDLERLELAEQVGGHPDPPALAVRILAAQARVAELTGEVEPTLSEPSQPEPLPSPARPPAAATALPEYLDTKRAASLLGISARTLEGLRARGQGPAHIRIGKRVLYPIATLRTTGK
jgi:hypothetical protein